MFSSSNNTWLADRRRPRPDSVSVDVPCNQPRESRASIWGTSTFYTRARGSITLWTGDSSVSLLGFRRMHFTSSTWSGGAKNSGSIDIPLFEEQSMIQNKQSTDTGSDSHQALFFISPDNKWSLMFGPVPSPSLFFVWGLASRVSGEIFWFSTATPEHVYLYWPGNMIDPPPIKCPWSTGSWKMDRHTRAPPFSLFHECRHALYIS